MNEGLVDAALVSACRNPPVFLLRAEYSSNDLVLSPASRSSFLRLRDNFFNYHKFHLINTFSFHAIRVVFCPLRVFWAWPAPQQEFTGQLALFSLTNKRQVNHQCGRSATPAFTGIKFQIPFEATHKAIVTLTTDVNRLISSLQMNVLIQQREDPSAHGRSLA